MRRPRIYLAAPLFTAGERDLNATIRDALAVHCDVYLPQEDGALLAEAIERGDDPEVASRYVFDCDVTALRDCDILLIVLNGRTVDEGAAFELGVAWALGKICVAYKDDPRQLLALGDNPMITQSVRTVFRKIEPLVEWAASCAWLDREGVPSFFEDAAHMPPSGAD
ncbi:nucleoside 2-deoxyribosyltransferase (plasmid) [Rhizobium sp. CC1099]|uniref:nucleoside 2-deoxyribosyltransferase n=1 Tax=Rhizobium sp. CC1099 TaxID=3039160 RepID=UPI0024B05CB8|nr:nucleoside 2-deoxyribosyltransferase [Rhizobium sp. CC1099]WFU91985.1 nucleoside 2-deoxyribosyltransferase [Rhizobium sp. CC1099]